MEKQVLFSGMSIEELLQHLRDIVRSELRAEKEAAEEKLLNSNEARKLFVPELSMSTLKLWTKEGKLKSYRIGGRVFYKQSEILEATKTLKKYKY